MSSELPIGIFDSGIGGVTVLKELAHRFPQENFLYLGDTARLPYGSKSAQTIRKYTEQNINWLIQQGVKAIVIACNTASTQMRESEFKKVPIYNVIDPGAKKAIKVSQNKIIGVLGTRATIASEAYPKEILKQDAKAIVYAQACPLFVPLAEEGWDEDAVTNLIAFRYLQDLTTHQIDTCILGCTHYPILKKSIQKVLGNSVQLVESGDAIADQMENDFKQNILETNKNKKTGEIKIVTTDESAQFQILAKRILNPLQVHHFSITSLS